MVMHERYGATTLAGMIVLETDSDPPDGHLPIRSRRQNGHRGLAQQQTRDEGMDKPRAGHDGKKKDDHSASVADETRNSIPPEQMTMDDTIFPDMVSHQLRTALNAITGSTAAVLSSPHPAGSPETVHSLRVIDEQANRMRQVINDLDDMTHLEAGTLTLWVQPTLVEHLLEQARETHAQGRAGSNRILLDLPPGLPRAMADEQRVSQVIRNIIDALSAQSPGQHPIRVNASVDGTFVKISAETKGQETAADGRPPRKNEIYQEWDGTGPDRMRLDFCKGIAEAHGGNCTAEEAGPEGGVRFSFTIPTADQGESGPETFSVQANRRPRKSKGGQTRILVVDGDPQSRRYIQHILTEAGFTPMGTGNADEAEHMAGSEHPQLVLTDLALPWTNGLELMKRIGEISDAPVIIMSGHGIPPLMEQALELGAADYLMKPVIPTELVPRIRAALRRQDKATGGQVRPTFTLGQLTINYDERTISVAGRTVELTNTEYMILAALSNSAGYVLSHDQILQRVHGPTYFRDERTIRTHVMTLRRKLGDAAAKPSFIFTEQGVGYRMPRPENDQEQGGD